MKAKVNSPSMFEEKESIQDKICGYLDEKNLTVSISASLFIGLLSGLIAGLIISPAHGINIWFVALFIFVFISLINGLAVFMSTGFAPGLVAIPVTIFFACFPYTIITGIRFLFS